MSDMALERMYVWMTPPDRDWVFSIQDLAPSFEIQKPPTSLPTFFVIATTFCHANTGAWVRY